MKTSHTVGIIIAVLVAGIGIRGYTTFSMYAPKEYVIDTPTGQTTVNTETNKTKSEVKKFTMTDIASHKDAKSCYSSISGEVYDLTAWVNMHPGGKNKILSICGTDGTKKFMARHHGAKKQMNILSRFKIGTLSL